ncbi:nmrA-like family protein [Aspergillus pseudoustus]|uniref:NmrA-like family protein n=1 Tax=Aspergillus pseudoustus TaxID=1810923 RepID=A0ABR4IVS3_9EURO
MAPAPLQKVIVVYGAMGTQGTTITLSLLESRQNFVVRVLTRKPESEKAQKLARLGAEIAVMKPEGSTDEDLGRRLVTLAAGAGVKVFIYSTCDSSSKITNGKAPVPGMDAKRRVELFAREFKEFDAMIGAWPAWYFENFIDAEYAQAFGGFPLQPDKEGYLTFTSPTLEEMVHALFLNPLQWHGCTVPCMSDSFSYEDMVKVFTEVTRKKARYIPMNSYKDFPTHGDSVLVELQDVYLYMQNENGWFFGKPDDTATCQQLKDEARADKGLQPQRLISMREYFSKHYGRN